MMFFLFFFWQRTGSILFQIPLWFKVILGGCILLSLAGFRWGVYSLPGFNPFGTRPHQMIPVKKPILRYWGPYKFMRHPLYFFSLVLIWSSTVVTIDRIMFNLIWTGWIFFGAWLEEKDLVGLFGEDYIEYKRKVPMILPIKW